MLTHRPLKHTDDTFVRRCSLWCCRASGLRSHRTTSCRLNCRTKFYDRRPRQTKMLANTLKRSIPGIQLDEGARLGNRTGNLEDNLGGPER